MFHHLLHLLLLPMLSMPGAESEPTVAAEEPVVCPSGFTCVPQEDMHAFIQLLQEAQCRDQTQPQIEADSITIIVDREGRIYGSGTGERLFTLHLKWCNYELEAKSNITIQAATRVEPEWGFRLRPKATFGILGVEAFKASKLNEGLDGGLLLEPFFYHWANANAYVGVRSLGAGVGVDITTNMGASLIAALTWVNWRLNPLLSVYFAF